MAEAGVLSLAPGVSAHGGFITLIRVMADVQGYERSLPEPLFTFGSGFSGGL